MPQQRRRGRGGGGRGRGSGANGNGNGHGGGGKRGKGKGGKRWQKKPPKGSVPMVVAEDWMRSDTGRWTTNTAPAFKRKLPTHVTLDGRWVGVLVCWRVCVLHACCLAHMFAL